MLSFLQMAWTCPGGHNSLLLQIPVRPEFVKAQPPFQRERVNTNPFDVRVDRYRCIMGLAREWLSV